jgi:phosphinothricin acetyltransferase
VSQRLLRHGRQVGRRQLDPRGVTVVPDPELAQTEIGQSGFGLIDLVQLFRRHRLEVRNPRGQAGSSRLVGARQAHGSREVPYVGLGQTKISQRAQDRVLDCCPRAGPVGANGIVGVLPVRHGSQPMRRSHLVVDSREQLGFAMEAAVNPVRLVGGLVTLVRADLDQRNAEKPGHRMRRIALPGRQAGGYSEDREHAVRAESTYGQRQQDRRVDATRERHAEALDATQHQGKVAHGAVDALAPVGLGHLGVPFSALLELSVVCDLYSALMVDPAAAVVSPLAIRAGAPSDLPALTDLYNHYVRHTVITFDLTPFTVEQRVAWFDQYAPTGPHRLLVAERDKRVIGYATSSQFRPRAAYAQTVAMTIYLHPECIGRGDGRRLYEALLVELGTEPVHRAYAGIALPNDASIRLHERLGFTPVGILREVGFKFGRYVDVQWFERPIP